jgi:hypothetical protein
MYEIILYYTYLSFLGFILLSARKDRHLIMNDLQMMIFRHNFLLSVINLFTIYLLLPITIPFTIINIIKK